MVTTQTPNKGPEQLPPSYLLKFAPMGPDPLRGTPALGQGVPRGCSGSRSALPAPFRLRPPGGAARPARCVPQFLAEGPRTRRAVREVCHVARDARA